MNLFASFILRALAVLVKDIVFYNSYSKRPNSESGWMSYLSEVIPSHLMGQSWWVGEGARVGEGDRDKRILKPF